MKHLLRNLTGRLTKCVQPVGLGIALVCMSLTTYAQTRSVNGRVTTVNDGAALPGVSVLVKGSTKGATTDADGRYRLEMPENGETLIFSFIGYATQEIPIGNRSTIDIALATDTKGLQEVVVTALGIKKEERTIGYATQKLESNNITVARETNVVNQLAGKIAGVTVVGSPSGIGGSSRITIRGERSLNINANQPLFVIDGMPISNGFTGSSGRGQQEADFGNGAGFVNPDDIESITVLKGANAAALYGDRAANGVVLITTKSGKGVKGIGVSVNSNITFESVLRLPDYQNV